MDATWQGGIPSNSAFDMQLPGGQNNEDWEDWLRWDPNADASTPDNDFSNSGSSKNDSPTQDAAFSISGLDFDDTLAPPLVVGEDTFDFSNIANTDTFAFGAVGSDVAPNFDFGATSAFQNDFQHTLPKAELNTPLFPLPSNAGPGNVPLLTPTHDGQQLGSSGSPSTTAPNTNGSPESLTNKRTSLSSQTSPAPAPKKRGGRKRKAEVEAERAEENGESQDGEPPVKKTSHNVIEKRYRNNLNDKIVELRNSVPSLRAMGRTNNGNDSEDLEGLTPAHKLNKATVMGKATEYIKHLEKRNKTLQTEMDALKARMASVEAAMTKSRDRQAAMANSSPGGTVRARELSSASQASLQQYLNVQPTQTPFAQPPMSQQYMQQQGPPTYNRPPNPPAEAQNQPQQFNARGGLVNKLMLGSMAGLMVMEGYTEQQSSGSDTSSRGLSAIPGLHLLKRGHMQTSTSAFSREAILPLFKIVLVFGALLYLLAPLLSFSPRRKQKARSAVRLPQAPSLASPVEVRRKAWLTAIQSVWIPKHFLLEVVAVTLRMIKLSVRRLMGTEMWATLTGTDKEEEAARIKAWDIAIDAQLAGGDAEVSYYRLLLTLMASGTLPDSPTRLMQKAVHFRVFFWEVANAGYGNLMMFKQFTEHVGKIYWDSARKLQKELINAQAQGRPNPDDDVDLLPDHLARLVELECDEVLSDEMIQRAWNLAWNNPSAYGIAPNTAKDSVIEDHAIRSPLDAVAAWYANTLVDDTLADTLANGASKFDIEYYLGLAVSVAPPASGTHSRALAAKAVLCSSNRETNIVAALDALPVASPTPSMNVVEHGPASPEVRTALTLSKLLSLSSSSVPVAARLNATSMLGHLHLAPQHFTLLTAVAAFRLLQTLGAERRLPAATSRSLEDLAGSLRVWVGTSAGRQAGLSSEERERIVEVCLIIARKFGGWEEKDSGYGGSIGGSKEVSPVRKRLA